MFELKKIIKKNNIHDEIKIQINRIEYFEQTYYINIFYK